jgi:hypothetical protein
MTLRFDIERTSAARILRNNSIDENDAIYQSLLEHKDEIELAVGGPLDWEAKESNRSRTVSLDLVKGGWADRSTWSSAIESTVSSMIKLEGSVRPFLNEAIAAGDEVAELPTSDVDVLDDPAEVEGLS